MFYLIFLFCQYLRWVQYARNRVHVTCFVRLKNEFNELGFYFCKPSSLNSIFIRINRVQWRFVLKETTILVGYVHRRHHSKKHFRHTKKPNTQKKLSSNFKHTVTLSHSLSLSVSPSHSQSSSLSLSHSHSELVAPSSAPSPAAPVAVAASRFRRSISASLSLSPSVVGELPHKSKDSLFFLLCLWGTDAVGMGVRD